MRWVERGRGLFAQNLDQLRHEFPLYDGRPMECRAYDAGLVGGQCLLKGVVYAMCCTLREGLYIGETARPVRLRFAEHYRDAKTLVGRSPWGRSQSL